MRFVRVLNSGVDRVTGTVEVQMLGDDQVRYNLDFSQKCVALLVTALAAELGKLPIVVGEQFIVAKSLATGVSNEGAPMLILTLEGGAKLPLVVQGGDLNELIVALQALTSSIAPGRPH